LKEKTLVSGELFYMIWFIENIFCMPLQRYWMILSFFFIVSNQPIFAHNGVVANAIELQAIIIDGDFSDWPDGLEHYDIDDPAFGKPPLDKLDFSGSYRIGYNEALQVLYVAVTVQDNHSIIDTTDMWNTQDGCEIYAYLNHLEVPSSSERSAYSTLQFSIYGDTRLTYGKTMLRAPYSVEVLRSGTTTQYEWMINIGQLAHGIRHLVPNSVIALDVVVIDKDQDESFSWMTWGPGVSKWGFADRLGDVLLIDDRNELSHVSGKVHWSNEKTGNEQGLVYVSASESTSNLRVKPDSAGVFEVKLPAMEYVFQAGYRRHLSQPRNVNVSASDSFSIAPISFDDPPYGERHIISGLSSVIAGEGSAAGYWHGHNVHDGLASNEINAISRDDSGIMLLGTENGISLFDGSTFISLDKRNGLTGNQVSFLNQTADGAIWIATSSGISRYQSETITTYTDVDGLAGNWVTSILEDDQGVLWIGSLHGGLSKFNGESFQKIETGFGYSIRAMVQDSNGIIWIATTEGLTSFDGDQFVNYTSEDGLPSEDITAIYEAADGKLWIGTKPGVDGIKWEEGGGACYMVDGEITRGPSLLEDPSIIPEYSEGNSRRDITCISEDLDGNIWLGTTAGLFVVKDNFSQQILVGDSRTDIKIKSLFHDGINQMWVGTNEGLRRYDGAVFSTYSLRELSAKKTTAIIEDDQNRIWVGTTSGIRILREDGIQETDMLAELPGEPIEYLFQSRGEGTWIGTPLGVYQYHNGKLKNFLKISFAQDGKPETDNQSPVVKASLVDSSYVRSIYQDREGAIWISVVDGLLRFKRGDISKLTTSEGLSASQINMVFEDSNRRLWVATANGISRYNGTSFTNYTTEDGLPSNWINDIVEAPDGRIWIATTQGVSAFDGTKFVNLRKRDGLSGDQAKSFFLSHDGTVWINTESGLTYVTGDSIKHHTIVDGLPSNKVNKMGQSRNGLIWFATDEGLSCYDGSTTQNLLKRDGLNDNAITDIVEAKNGDHWILTDVGVTQIRPEYSDPRILISTVVADEVYTPDMQIKIPTTQRQIAINFKGLTFQTRRKLISYAYRLIGHDKTWKYSRKNVVYYDNLSSGTYKFEVKTIDRSFNYSKQKAIVEFEVIYVPEASSIGLGEIEVEEIYASFYKTYGIRPAGNAQIFNKNEMPVQATLQYYLPELMKRPTEKKFTIPPRAKIILPFYAQLDNELLDVRGQRVWEAEVELSYSVGSQTVSVEKKVPINIHGRGVLTWDTVAKAATFVTPEHAPIASFARGLLAKFEASSAKGIVNKNILRAMLMFEGLNALGVKYAPDANTPFHRARGDVVALDNIQYPFELMQSLLGDCDDNTVLYCSLLENLNIPTAFVDVPGHILMMFDSGIPSNRSLGTLLPNSMFVEHRGSLWVPIEVTVLGEGRLFFDAWELGAKTLSKIDTSLPNALVVVSDAWSVYPYGDLQEEYSIEWPTADLLRNNLRENLDQIEDMHGVFFDNTYVRPLLKNPNDDQLRLNMARAHIESGKFYLALTQLPLISGTLKAQALYLIGYSYAGLGDLRFAAGYIEEAIKLQPEHFGYMESLCWIYSEIISKQL
jgi:ligand-binding sensor domain-containing protein